MQEQKANNRIGNFLQILIITGIVYTGLGLTGTLILYLFPSVFFSGSHSLAEIAGTAFSLVTLTGQSFFSPAQLTFSGQLLTLLLIETGAVAGIYLGCYYSYFYKLFKKPHRSGLFSLILKTVFGIQILFAIPIMLFWGDKVKFDSFFQLLFYSFFHSVSAFCNVGFTLFDHSFSGPETSALYVLFLVFTVPMFLGSLGFPVLYDLFSIRRLRERLVNPNSDWMRFSKVIFYGSLFLIFIAGAVFFYSGIFKSGYEAKLMEKGIAAFFHSVSLRNTGFYSSEPLDWSSLSFYITLFAMLIGGGVAGTSGGLSLLYFRKLINLPINKKNRNAYSRESYFLLYLLLLVIAWIMLFSSILYFSQSEYSFPVILFNVISCFTNTGWVAGKEYMFSENTIFLFIALMLSGRILSVSLAAKLLYSYLKMEKNKKAPNDLSEFTH